MMEPGVLVNARKRSIRWPGIAGARVRGGTVSSRDRTGMGDCILMDLTKGFFAVSDSSSRNPTASRGFLSKFVKKLEGLTLLAPGRILSLDEFRGIRTRLVVRSEELLQTIPYTDSCTFTGVLIARTEAGMRGILFHTGDSLLFRVNPRTAECEEVTRSNFWMVGRSKQFFQVDELTMPPDTILVVTTDGISDLNHRGDSDRTESIVRLTLGHPVEAVPDELVESLDLQRGPTDDIGIIALRPNRLRSVETKIVLGGTTYEEESLYQERCNRGVYDDRYVPIVTPPT